MKWIRIGLFSRILRKEPTVLQVNKKFSFLGGCVFSLTEFSEFELVMWLVESRHPCCNWIIFFKYKNKKLIVLLHNITNRVIITIITNKANREPVFDLNQLLVEQVFKQFYFSFLLVEDVTILSSSLEM